MARICFVSNEIYPTTPGGAGALIFRLAEKLLAEGNEVVLLLELSRNAFQHFNQVDRLLLPAPSRCRAYLVEELCGHMPYSESDFPSHFLWEAYRYDYAGRQIYERERPDFIEFVDYCGPAYYALCTKIAGLSYQESHLTVRIHGSVESIDRHTRYRTIDFDRYTIYALERFSLRLAESVLYPTPSALQEYAQAGHPPWFGNAILSHPPIPSQPTHQAEKEENPNIVLFYGRLAAVKGVDLFVEAAVRFLIENPESLLEFYLVGYDSREPPNHEALSYQEYLLRKVPAKYKDRFVFTGFLDRPQFEKLIPKVKLAIFPSYYESFCLAAHELRQFGIPLILSSIPAFTDHFQPGIDALFFDGTIGHLSSQIKLLDTDRGLRLALSQPRLPESTDICEFYRSIPRSTWIERSKPDRQPDLLTLIIEDQQKSDRTQKTLTSLANIPLDDEQIIILRKRQGKDEPQSAVQLFGNWYELRTRAGRPILPIHVRLKKGLLILRSGDEPAPLFIQQSQETLCKQPQISFIGCWKWIGQRRKNSLYTHPIAAMMELAPLEGISPFNRCIMRTEPEALLIDLFNPREGLFAEVGYLWKLDTDQTCGIQLPEAFIRQEPEKFSFAGTDYLSYLILQDMTKSRLSNLARYLSIVIKAYPKPLLPLQSYWAKRFGIYQTLRRKKRFSITSKTTLRNRLSKRLAQGGPYSQKTLFYLRKLRSFLRKWL